MRKSSFFTESECAVIKAVGENSRLDAGSISVDSCDFLRTALLKAVTSAVGFQEYWFIMTRSEPKQEPYKFGEQAIAAVLRDGICSLEAVGDLEKFALSPAAMAELATMIKAEFVPSAYSALNIHWCWSFGLAHEMRRVAAGAGLPAVTANRYAYGLLCGCDEPCVTRQTDRPGEQLLLELALRHDVAIRWASGSWSNEVMATVTREPGWDSATVIKAMGLTDQEGSQAFLHAFLAESWTLEEVVRLAKQPTTAPSSV